MALRVKGLIGAVLLAAALGGSIAAARPAMHWLLFIAYLLAILLSSGMKVSLPARESSMSVNFPIIFLAVMQLSPFQAMSLAALSVFAQCKFKVEKLFSLVQVAFNVANAVNATALSWLVYVSLLRLHCSSPPAISAAAFVYFLASTVPVATVVGWTRGESVRGMWRSTFVWFLPFYLVGAGLAALANFLSFHYGWSTALLVVPMAYTIYRAYNAQAARIRDRAQHAVEMEALHLRTIEGLAMAIEAKDQDTHDHLLRVRVYVTELGRALKLTPAEMEAVKTAALLHDIGKLAVPERIINKPGKLTPEEFEKMKIHPVVGADILERVRFPYPVVPIVRAHHEWWNGMGYPDGLRGEAIPIGARILTVVDSFDAMASDRPYRRAMPLAEAMAVVKKLSGTQFDPQVVDVLEKRYVTLEEQARKEGEKLHRLNTEVETARGMAPGAGFAEESDAAAGTPQGRPAESDDPVLRSPEGMPLIAAAHAQAEALLGVVDSFLDSRMDSQTDSPAGPFTREHILGLFASSLAPLIPFDCLVLYLKREDRLVPVRLPGESALLFSAEEIAVGQGISGWVALHERSMLNGNATVEPNYRGTGDGIGLRSALAIPLHDIESNASIYAVLSMYAAAPNAFSRHHLRALEAIETKLTLALRKAVPAVLPQPSVETLLLQVEQALERCTLERGPLTLVMCDLAPWHSVQAGSSIVTQSEYVLRGMGSPRESILHLGSHFVLLLPGLNEHQAAARTAALRERADLLLSEDGVTAGIGLASYPADGATAEALLAVAERRMHVDRRERLQAVLASPVEVA